MKKVDDLYMDCPKNDTAGSTVKLVQVHRAR